LTVRLGVFIVLSRLLATKQKIAEKNSIKFFHIHWLYHKLTYLVIDDRGASKRPSLCRTWVPSSSEMWYRHSQTVSICLQHIPVHNKHLVEMLKALSFMN